MLPGRPSTQVRSQAPLLNTIMRILELLHGRTLREDGTDLTDPVSGTGTSVAPGAGSSVTAPASTPSASNLSRPLGQMTRVGNSPGAPPSGAQSPFAFLDNPAPVNPQTGRPPPGFGPTLPGYQKDAGGNWTNPQGRPPDTMVGSGNLRFPAWEIPQSPAEKATSQQAIHNADQQYQTRGDMSGWDKLLGWDENAAFNTARSMLNRR
jgi:hypothetical protein